MGLKLDLFFWAENWLLNVLVLLAGWIVIVWQGNQDKLSRVLHSCKRCTPDSELLAQSARQQVERSHAPASAQLGKHDLMLMHMIKHVPDQGISA